jgi:hypothetical protein
LPEVLGTLGAWMFELRTESASSIIDDYLQKSVQVTLAFSQNTRLPT